MENIYIQYFKTPFGELVLGSFEKKLCLCDWRYRTHRKSIDDRIQSALNANYIEKNTPVIEFAIRQLKHYFHHRRRHFTVPLLMAGTQFQCKVWDELVKINYGATVTYSELALKLGNKLTIRAVAAANGANALSIFIPCHRVIGSDGNLVGYAGGLNAKKKLLELENPARGSHQLDLF